MLFAHIWNFQNLKFPMYRKEVNSLQWEDQSLWLFSYAFQRESEHAINEHFLHIFDTSRARAYNSGVSQALKKAR